MYCLLRVHISSIDGKESNTMIGIDTQVEHLDEVYARSFIIDFSGSSIALGNFVMYT